MGERRRGQYWRIVRGVPRELCEQRSGGDSAQDAGARPQPCARGQRRADSATAADQCCTGADLSMRRSADAAAEEEGGYTADQAGRYIPAEAQAAARGGCRAPPVRSAARCHYGRRRNRHWSWSWAWRRYGWTRRWRRYAARWLSEIASYAGAAAWPSPRCRVDPGRWRVYNFAHCVVVLPSRARQDVEGMIGLLHKMQRRGCSEALHDRFNQLQLRKLVAGAL